jgi:hypothetical protein
VIHPGSPVFPITDSSYIPSSVMYGNFTFTSPTVYLAHHPISITNDNVTYVIRNGTYSTIDGSKTTQLLPAGIISLKSEDVYSIRPEPCERSILGVQHAQRIAKGDFDPPLCAETRYRTYPFDFGHLQDPVPASVFYDARTDCSARQSHCGTITDGNYRPLLSIANTIWNSILPPDVICRQPVVVDPAIALYPILASTLDEPTIFAAVTTGAATPRGNLISTLPRSTSSAKAEPTREKKDGTTDSPVSTLPRSTPSAEAEPTSERKNGPADSPVPTINPARFSSDSGIIWLTLSAHRWIWVLIAIIAQVEVSMT